MGTNTRIAPTPAITPSTSRLSTHVPPSPTAPISPDARSLMGFRHRLARPIADVLPRSGQTIEDRRLPCVGVADECDDDAIAASPRGIVPINSAVRGPGHQGASATRIIEASVARIAIWPPMTANSIGSPSGALRSALTVVPGTYPISRNLRAGAIAVNPMTRALSPISISSSVRNSSDCSAVPTSSVTYSLGWLHHTPGLSGTLSPNRQLQGLSAAPLGRSESCR